MASVTTTARAARVAHTSRIALELGAAAADEDRIGVGQLGQRARRARPWTTRTGTSWARALRVRPLDRVERRRRSPIAAAPSRAHSIATEPLPQPTSQIRSPIRGPSRASASARTSALVTIPAR